MSTVRENAVDVLTEYTCNRVFHNEARPRIEKTLNSYTNECLTAVTEAYNDEDNDNGNRAYIVASMISRGCSEPVLLEWLSYSPLVDTDPHVAMEMMSTLQHYKKLRMVPDGRTKESRLRIISLLLASYTIAHGLYDTLEVNDPTWEDDYTPFGMKMETDEVLGRGRYITDGLLVQRILNHPEDAERIIETAIARTSAHYDVVQPVVDHVVQPLSEGVL